MRSSAAAFEDVSTHVADVLNRSEDLVLQSAMIQRQSQGLLRRSASLSAEMQRLKRRIEDSIVRGFVVAREGRRLARKLRRPYASPTEVELRIVDLAGFRRRPPAA